MYPERIVDTQENIIQQPKPFSPLGTFLKIILLVIGSWVLVHLFAILGIFVAVAYPLWYLFAPQTTVCLLCRFHQHDYKCPFCKRITKPGDSKTPSSLWSAVQNGFLVFIFSLVSVGFVYVERLVLNSLGIPPTEKTVSFVIPDKGQYKLEEMFSMDIDVSGIEVPVNAVQADIKFDQERIEIVDIITEYSFADVFIQKSINNDLGYARLTGGLPSPGYEGDKGIFGTVLFKGISPGVVTVEFLPTSLVLANDGKGTNVLKDYAKASYLILAEKLTEDEISLQNELLAEHVLGVQDESTKLEFFDDYPDEILGVEDEILGTDNAVQSDEDSVPWNLWHILEKIDDFIIGFWDWVAGLFN